MNDFNEVFAKLQPELQVLEEDRIASRNRKKKLWRIFWILFLVGGALIALDLGEVVRFHRDMFLGAIIGGVIILVTLIVVGIIVSKINSKYRQSFKYNVVTKIVHAINEGLHYEPYSAVNMSKFIESDLFKHYPDRYKGEDYMAGKIGKTDMEMSELHCEYRYTTTDSEGRTQTRYRTFFRGLFMIADFHKDFKGKTVVLPDTMEKSLGWLGKKFQKMNWGRDQLVTLEDPEFEKEFAVYSDDQVEARYLLSTSMMRRIVDLQKRLDCKMYFSFLYSNLYMGIYWNKNLFEPNMKKSLLDSDEIREFYDEITLCVGLVEDLNLNTRIWTKE